MKNKPIQKLLLSAAVLLSALVGAQTINTGDLYITPGTIVSTVGAMDNKSTGNLFNDGDFYVYSHYNNDGLVTFGTGTKTGITRMRGKLGFQNISGSMPMQWYNAEFNNSNVQPAFHLSNEVSISGISDFRQGIVDDDNYGGLLVFEKAANHVNVDDASFVDGYVQKNGNDAFQFPIGDAQYFRYAAISTPNNASDVFTGKYFYENPDTSYPLANKTGVIELIDNQEYWTVTRDAGNSDIMLTLSWDDSTTTPTAIPVAPESAIHIVRWDAAQQLWVDEGGVADVANKNITTAVAVDGYGVFTLARVKEELILPGNVVVYNAVSPNEDGKNDYFVIDNIQGLQNNNVMIFNRWGVKVFETNNYGTNGNVFDGYSDGRSTVSPDKKLPEGTYFYILSYDFNNGTGVQRVKHSGYLYLKTD